MPVSTSQSTNFFDSVETQSLPVTQAKVQPWKGFHSPKESLAHTGSVVVDIPKTDGTGKWSEIGRPAPKCTTLGTWVV